MDKKVEKAGVDFYDEFPQSLKESIEIGLKQIEAGEYQEHEEVMKEIKNKLGISL